MTSDAEARLRWLEREVERLRQRVRSLEETLGRNQQLLALARGNVQSEH